MTRQKNALTGYFVASMPSNGEEPEYMQLAKWISSVTDDTDETSEATGYYDGDGNPTTDVTARLEQYSFEGMYDKGDPAMAFINSIKREVGEGRKIMFKKVDSDGTEIEGPATVTVPITSGGEATEFATFSCTIGFDRKPTITATP
ncbi:phage tail tube protein [Halalkalibacter sp. APA_J-10(15)]|uniref:phage tail tube protein n=1 Tax=Halalkalibacter sp. APA_J-10(15) TaxID=2933805 RepID=UPI001FF60AD3|nr:phage tail protein [Halalkalibacter sp. APA_J-10(15)]MCK0473780.1 phage tail protein [Halalkalibacter sp. APA_J-10(15)]